ncbi:MAG: hypothetical protein LBL67_01490 [Coriobacteriales bacterium]|nr:hypothetical protein [Coriobacteriales bacterium]
MAHGEGAFAHSWQNPTGPARRGPDRKQASPQPDRGRDIEVSLPLSFDEAFTGLTKTVSVKAGGKKQTLKVKVPAGAVDGGKLRFKGKGAAGAGGAKAGDLVIKTILEDHPLYRREGADVVFDLPLSPAELGLGTNVTVPTPAHQKIKIKIPAGTPDGKVLVLKGKGAPDVASKNERHGDLKVICHMSLPAQPNPGQLEALKRYLAASPADGCDIRPQITGLLD